jgi:hypothetical protein
MQVLNLRINPYDVESTRRLKNREHSPFVLALYDAFFRRKIKNIVITAHSDRIDLYHDGIVDFNLLTTIRIENQLPNFQELYLHPDLLDDKNFTDLLVFIRI